MIDNSTDEKRKQKGTKIDKIDKMIDTSDNRMVDRYKYRQVDR